MGMQGRLGIPPDLVVHAVTSADLEQHISDERHIAQEDNTLLQPKRIQARHDGIGEQKAIAGKRLDITDNQPSGRQTADGR